MKKKFSKLEISFLADLFYSHKGLEVIKNEGTIICCKGDNYHSVAMMVHALNQKWAEHKGKYLKLTQVGRELWLNPSTPHE